MRQRRNLAAALGGWSARHRKTAIISWLLLVVAAAFIGGALGQVGLTDAQEGTGDSARALQILAGAGITAPAGEMVLVHSDAQTSGSAAFHTAVASVISGVKGTGQVDDILDPYTTGLISKDGHDALVRFDMTGTSDSAADRVQPVLDAVARTQAGHPGFTVGEFGDASGEAWYNKAIGTDFGRAEWTAVPLALGILLVAFGALVAALLPVLLALTAIFTATGLLAIGSHLMGGVDSSANSVMLLVGLAVGVDYCLFYLRREREERRAGRDRETALRIAATTSGRSVLVSGLTVMVAMSGMFLSGLLLFKGFALATIIVVLIAMVGSVTVLPALLSLLGDRVDRGRLPFVAKRRARRQSRRQAARAAQPATATGWVRALQRSPKLFAAFSAGFLLLLALPAIGMHTEKLSTDQQVPASIPLMQTYRQIVAAFPGSPAPAQIVVKATDIGSAKNTTAIADFRTAVASAGVAGGPLQVTVYQKAGVAEIDVPLVGSGSDATSVHALDLLRSQLVPQAFGQVPGDQAVVGGNLAFSLDFNNQLKHSILPVFLFVLGITFLLMLVAFRSVVVAATSIVLNLLSVAASYGVMVAVFQHGWGASLVNTTAPGAIESWLPLFVFVILFGLSMDYHVFVVSRIREARLRGLSTTDAVAHGLRGTAGAVTSAAAIMVAVFAVFGTLSMQDFKQLGVGLAVAVLLDATIVRCLLLPSVMILLGERNWYLPRWLGWLPKARLTEAEEGVDAGSLPAPGAAVAAGVQRPLQVS
ncbi:MAG TPA: MMPL family transporter [Actinocrinis sp.]|nr:MMPL family transporter [Actinocrinis sp.]